MVQLLEERELLLKQLRHNLSVRITLNPVFLIDLDGAHHVSSQVQSFVHFSKSATTKHPGPSVVLSDVIYSVHTFSVPEVDSLDL